MAGKNDDSTAGFKGRVALGALHLRREGAIVGRRGIRLCDGVGAGYVTGFRIDFCNEVPAVVAGRADAGRGLSRRRGGDAKAIRRDAIHRAEPAQRHLRSWRGCRAPVPPFFPSGASPEGKREVGFGRWLEESSAHGLVRDPGGAWPVVLATARDQITEGLRYHWESTSKMPSDCPRKQEQPTRGRKATIRM